MWLCAVRDCIILVYRYMHSGSSLYKTPFVHNIQTINECMCGLLCVCCMHMKWKRNGKGKLLTKQNYEEEPKKKMKEYNVEEEKVRRICDFIGLCMDELKWIWLNLNWRIKCRNIQHTTHFYHTFEKKNVFRPFEWRRCFWSFINLLPHQLSNAAITRRRCK